VEAAALSYKGFRFPAEIIAHAVWLYHRFPLSYREVEELLLARGIVVSHETIRQWCDRFGPQYAVGLRHRRPQARDKWHLDEVFIKINGVRHYLWRAVDQDGSVLDILVQSKRDAKAAKRFLVKLMKKQRRVPRVLVTDKLRSYGVAHRELMRSVEHRSHKGLNNRAENSHQPTRQRERAMKGFRSAGRTQRFLSVFSQISPHFRPRRHRMTATDYRTEMQHRFTTWNQITGTTAMPATA
jgi:putative transposase